MLLLAFFCVSLKGGKCVVRKCLKAIVPRPFAVAADAPQSTFLFVPEARTDNEQNRGMRSTFQHGARPFAHNFRTAPARRAGQTEHDHLPITSTQSPRGGLHKRSTTIWTTFNSLLTKFNTSTFVKIRVQTIYRQQPPERPDEVQLFHRLKSNGKVGFLNRFI